MGQNAKRARVEQIRTLQASWNDPPNLANDQEKFDLARKFVDGLKKSQKESLLKVNLARRVYVAAQENDGAVPPPKPVGRPRSSTSTSKLS